MIETKESRVKRFRSFERLLTSDAGQDLMDELKEYWDDYKLIGKSPEETAYKVGQRDAYKFLEFITMGNFDDV